MRFRSVVRMNPLSLTGAELLANDYVACFPFTRRAVGSLPGTGSSTGLSSTSPSPYNTEKIARSEIAHSLRFELLA